MDKLVVPTPSNGYPLNNDDVRYLLGISPYSDGIYQALEGILSAYGTSFIVSGCVATGSNISEGWVMLDGELIKVDAHISTDPFFEKVITYNSDGNKQTQTGGFADAYQQNRATATASSGTLANPAMGSPDYMPKATILALIQSDSDFAANETDRGCVRIADETTARTGANNTEAMTSLRVLDAIRNSTAFLAQTSYAGVVEKATSAEVDSGTSNKYVDAALLAGKDGGLKSKIIEIGDWNMDTSTSPFSSIPHGLVASNIRNINVIIRNDSNNAFVPLNIDTSGSGAAGNYAADGTNIGLIRFPGSVFDGLDFNATSYNRGWIIIDYIP